MGWIGVDLDGTLAEYNGWNGGSIGKPIPKMVERIKKWVTEGKDVRIMTARVSRSSERDSAARAITLWCVEHLGFPLPITCMKDYTMIELWDDRAVQVVPNTGERVDGNE